MASILSRLKFIIDGDNRKFLSSIQQSQKKIVGFQKTVSNLAKAGTAIFAGGQLTSIISRSIELADRQRVAEKQLLVALQGRVGIQDRLIRQAQLLQRQTVIGDEAIIEQQKFLATLGFTENQIKEIIPAALNLSAALGQTFEFGVRNLAKTFSGLTGELGELIPQLKDFTTSQLKAGDAVKFATTQFRGQAAVLANEGSGAIKQFKNLVGDAAEALGELVLPSISSSIKELSDTLAAFLILKDADISKFDKIIGALQVLDGGLTSEGIEKALIAAGKMPAVLEDAADNATDVNQLMVELGLSAQKTDKWWTGLNDRIKEQSKLEEESARASEDAARRKVEALIAHRDAVNEAFNAVGRLINQTRRQGQFAPEIDTVLPGNVSQQAEAEILAINAANKRIKFENLGKGSTEELNQSLANTLDLTGQLQFAFGALFQTIISGAENGTKAIDVLFNLLTGVIFSVATQGISGAVGGLFGGGIGGGGRASANLKTTIGPDGLNFTLAQGASKQQQLGN